MTVDRKHKRVSLPVLQGHGSGGDGSEAFGESKLAWILLAILTTFVVLLPLSMLVGPAVVRLYAAAPTQRGAAGLAVVLAVTAVVTSCIAATALVARFGPALRHRDSLGIGLLVGLILWALSQQPLGAVILGATLPAAWVGGRIGRRPVQR